MKLKKLSDKITVSILYLITIEVSVALALAINFMYDYHFFGSDSEMYPIQKAMSHITETEYSKISEYVGLEIDSKSQNGLSQERQTIYNSYINEFSPKNKNIVFRAEGRDGTLILCNDKSFDVENSYFTGAHSFNVFTEKEGDVGGKITLYVRRDMSSLDNYKLAIKLIDIAHSLRYVIFVVLFVLICVAAFLLGLLMYSVNGPRDTKRAGFLDRIPLDLLTIITLLIITFMLVLMLLSSVPDIKETNLVLWNTIILTVGLIQSVIILFFCISLASRIKAGNMLRNTIPYKIYQKVKKKKEDKGKTKVPFVWKTMLVIGALLLIELASIFYFVYRYKTCESGLLEDFNFLFFAFAQLALVFILGSTFFLVFLNLNAVRENGKKIASGDYQSIPDSHIMFGDFKAINDDLIAIKDNMISALEEKNRSQEMRNELITNISHDIKTPLTSIVNYADIIGSGKCSDEDIVMYSDVIKKQSNRLKDLLRSLIDVSKISTGSIDLHPEPTDISLFTAQVIDELTFNFSDRNLKTELSIPKEAIMVNVDASNLWRVFENIFSNVYKYAMEGTRVYIDVAKNDNKVSVSVKNTSAEPITIPPDELLMRFMRNDKSRHTEGHGLGLSIAKSFTEVQGGSFDLSVDGDLFKTTITFDVIQQANISN